MNLHSPEISIVYRVLKREFHKHRMPVVDLIEMQTGDPFKVLVTTILSARTRDETTVAAANRLFSKVRLPNDLLSLSEAQISKLIFPVGFFRDKAKHLKELPDALNKHFEGKIPSDVENLVILPGVGRKTANLVVAVAFGKPAVCVDIHVHRIFNRLGYIHTTSPLKTELELRKWFPEKYWITFNSYFVSFGQHTCLPVNPRCSNCPVLQYCSRVEVKTKFNPKS